MDHEACEAEFKCYRCCGGRESERTRKRCCDDRLVWTDFGSDKERHCRTERNVLRLNGQCDGVLVDNHIRAKEAIRGAFGDGSAVHINDAY